jgi:hypothetical protein
VAQTTATLAANAQLNLLLPLPGRKAACVVALLRPMGANRKKKKKKGPFHGTGSLAGAICKKDGLIEGCHIIGCPINKPTLVCVEPI